MNKFNDLTGQKFGKLTVIKRIENKSKSDHHIKWLCKCECGESVITRGSSLRNGITKSCGCLVKDVIAKTNELGRKNNVYDLSKDYGIGYSSNNNEVFYFDLEDYDKIKDYCWYSNHDGYMCSSDKNKHLIMHRFIMNEMDTEINIDHFNRNKKDNRKENLRLVTKQHNNWNKGLQTNNSSGVTGVAWNKKAKKWVSYIMHEYLGSFNNLDDAIKARKDAEYRYFGKWSYNNNTNIN